jgi:aldehyde:ferredoxin oxidoreductase
MENTYGWQGKILRLNLTSGDTQHQSTEDMAERFIGGRGFLTKIYWDEVDSKTDALHPDSPIIIMTGPLAGTSAPSCNRWFIGGKSPLLNPEQFGLGNVGGSMAAFIKAAGLDGMIITGKTAKPSYIHIKDNKCEIKDANGLWGLGIPETLKRLTAAHGKNSRSICIGPAGENQVKLAIAMSDNNSCGGSGFGAVMGSKNLKAIVIEGSQKVSVARPDELKKINQQVRSLIEGRVLMDPILEGIELVKRSPCFGCPSGCPRGLYKHVSGKEEIRKNCAAAYTYYSWDRLQNNNESTPVPFLFTSLLDDYGICGQEISNMYNFIYECHKHGLLPEDKTGIRVSEQGTLEYAQKLLDMLTYRKGFGDILAEGTIRAAKAIGKDAEALLDKRVNKSGFNANAYNPRFFITNAPFYATESTSTLNQLHEVSFPLMKWAMWFATEGAYSPFSTEVLQKIARKFWKNEKAVDFSTYEGKGEVAVIIQNREYAKENLVACDFMFPITTSEGAENNVGDPTLESRLLSAVTGLDINEKEYYRTGERVFNLQRAIQLREGRNGRKDDQINEFNFTEPLENDPGFFDVFNPELMLPGPGGELISRKGCVVEKDKFEKMMDEYYEIRGWDVATGLQKKETLESLDLPEIIPELEDKGLLTKE